MENPVEAIKKRIDIVEYIGSFITLKKAGRNFKAICPFHNEKTPSFIVSPERQIWHCFGACSEGGDVIKFLMKWENITFFEALKELAKKVNIPLKNISFEDKVWKKRERYFYMNQLASEFYHYILNKTKYGEKALDYLKKRSINEAIIKKFQIGYAPLGWDSLKLFLKKKKFPEEEIYDNGLIIKGEKGGYYDRFRGRLIFPIKDSRGYILGFSGRILEDKKKEAKYINTPETLIYHKRETLFGIDLAKESIKKENNVYIVEGEFDMISPYQFGFTNFVAIKGTALTDEQLMLLKRYSEKITLALDADLAGQESTKRSIEQAERLNLEIRVVKLPKGKDPDELVRNDLIAFKKAIQKPIPIYDFLIENAQKKYPEDNSFDKKKIADEVLPFFERITNPIVRSFYIKKIANILNVSEKSIELMIEKIKKEKRKSLSFKLKTKLQAKEDRQIIIEKYLLGMLFQEENPFALARKVFSELTPDDFFIIAHQKIMKLFLDDQTLKEKENKKFNLVDFLNKLSPELKEVFDEVYLFPSSQEVFDLKDLEKIVLEIKRYSLKRKIKKILDLEDDSEKVRKQLQFLNSQLKEVDKKLNF